MRKRAVKGVRKLMQTKECGKMILSISEQCMFHTYVYKKLRFMEMCVLIMIRNTNPVCNFSTC